MLITVFETHELDFYDRCFVETTGCVAYKYAGLGTP